LISNAERTFRTLVRLTPVFDFLAEAGCHLLEHGGCIDNTFQKGGNMIMALIDFEVSSEARSGLLQTLQPLLAEARKVEGNLSYRALTDSESDTHVGMVHEWETLEHFRAYASSDLVDRIGKVMRPAMITPPVSRRLRTESIEEVRG
jgi:quinol monooxygenase YgiN